MENLKPIPERFAKTDYRIMNAGALGASFRAPPDKIRCLLISDFNVETLKACIQNTEEPPDVQAIAAPFGQVVPALNGSLAEYCDPLPHCAVVWTQPERVIPAYAALLRHEAAAVEDILREVDAYARLIVEFHKSVAAVFVPSWLLPPHAAGHGMLSMKCGSGAANILMRMNLRLAECFQSASGIHLLDAQSWALRSGRNAFSPKLWYMCKVPFGNEMFQAAAADIRSALRALSGGARKLIILDLDNTLWGGTVGETGWRGLKLGGHNAVSEAYADFQSALKALTRRGVILGICSKNTESVAIEAIRSHPEMILTLDDFAGWRINWRDKAQNIVELTDELRLGLESAVFIDDSPAERARVRSALPNVMVPEWPASPLFYKDALLDLPFFDVPGLSPEDKARTAMYAAERQRKESRHRVESVEDWLRSLNIRIRVEELNDGNLQRVVQLLNKTNQMNLRTRRMGGAELLGWMNGGVRKLWTFRVSDRFGDQGLCGVVSFETGDGAGHIVDFVLSCRVIGRKVEETMLHTAISYARANGIGPVRAKYFATPRNAPCLNFLERSGMTRDAETGAFEWTTDRDYPCPGPVTVEGP